MRRVWIAALGAALCVVSFGCSDDDGGDPPQAACTVLWETQLRVGSRITGDAPAAGRFSEYLIDFDGNVTHPASIGCTNSVARGLAGACRVCEAAPGECELSVRDAFADLDASCHVCGDGACSGDETSDACPEDCGTQCGDGICDVGESVLACPVDCAVACGDRVCAEGETPDTCPADCNYSIGNGTCEPGESPEISPIDCQSGTCGDRVCQSFETSLLCPTDCCVPAACNVDGPVCADDDTLGECLVVGQGNCPEIVNLQPCEYGCARVGADYDCNPNDETCLRGRCQTCESVAADHVQSMGLDSMFVIIGCTPGTTTCADPTMGAGTATCVAVPGYPDCGYAPIEYCPMGEVCTDGACGPPP